jgi:hypothetical protein
MTSAPHPGARPCASARLQCGAKHHRYQQQHSPNTVRRVLNEREVFLIFIKVLFKCMERYDDMQLRQRAKAIVLECTKRNRYGDPTFSSLQDVVERCLKNIVGDTCWNKARVFTGAFCNQIGLQTSLSV